MAFRCYDSDFIGIYSNTAYLTANMPAPKWAREEKSLSFIIAHSLPPPYHDQNMLWLGWSCNNPYIISALLCSAQPRYCLVILSPDHQSGPWVARPVGLKNVQSIVHGGSMSFPW